MKYVVTSSVKKFLTRTKQSALLMLCVMVCVTTLVAMPPKKAEALLGVGDIVLDPSNLIKNSLTAAQSIISSGLLEGINFKELTLDNIAWNLAKKLLAQHTSAILDWVNGATDGKVKFITNYDQHYSDTAQRNITGFLAQDNFAQLCQPLQQPVQVILNQVAAEASDFQYQSECTTAAETPDSLESFFELVTNPFNNIYGAVTLSAGRMRASVEAGVRSEETRVIANNGYPGVEQCDEATGRCVITTPGSAIAARVNFSLNAGDQSLINADEINEIIGGLFSDLGQKALDGIGGMLGLSYTQNGQTTSLTNQVFNEEPPNRDFQSSSFIIDAIALERKYQSNYEQGITKLEAVRTKCSAFTSAAAQRVVRDVDALIGLNGEYTTEVQLSALIIQFLEGMKSQFDTARTAEELSAIMQGFQEVKREYLHTASEENQSAFDIGEKISDLEDCN
jgi:hypothetical protein